MSFVYRSVFVASVVATIGFAILGYVERTRLANKIREASAIANTPIAIAKLPEVSILQSELNKSALQVEKSETAFRSLRQDFFANKGSTQLKTRSDDFEEKLLAAKRSLTLPSESPILTTYNKAKKSNEDANEAIQKQIAALEQKLLEVEKEKSATDLTSVGMILGWMTSISTLWLSWRKESRDSKMARQDDDERSKTPTQLPIQ